MCLLYLYLSSEMCSFGSGRPARGGSHARVRCVGAASLSMSFASVFISVLRHHTDYTRHYMVCYILCTVATNSCHMTTTTGRRGRERGHRPHGARGLSWPRSRAAPAPQYPTTTRRHARRLPACGSARRPPLNCGGSPRAERRNFRLPIVRLPPPRPGRRAASHNTTTRYRRRASVPHNRWLSHRRRFLSSPCLPPSVPSGRVMTLNDPFKV